MRLNKLHKSLKNFSDNNDNSSNSQKDVVVLTDDDRFHYEKRYVEGSSVKNQRQLMS